MTVCTVAAKSLLTKVEIGCPIAGRRSLEAPKNAADGSYSWSTILNLDF